MGLLYGESVRNSDYRGFQISGGCIHSPGHVLLLCVLANICEIRVRNPKRPQAQNRSRNVPRLGLAALSP